MTMKYSNRRIFVAARSKCNVHVPMKYELKSLGKLQLLKTENFFEKTEESNVHFITSITISFLVLLMSQQTKCQRKHSRKF